ncbi:ATP-grasp domain-containing protein [bacterium]|nr:ATP-grasp domain-containing protein [bacterium]
MTADTKLRVVVTDGGERSALAAVRSLGRAGHYVSVGASSLPCLAGRSRHAAGVFTYMNPTIDQGGFLDDILGECRRFAADLIMPMTDDTAFAIARARDRVEAVVGVFQPGFDELRLAADKLGMFHLARELAVPVPVTFEMEHPDVALPALEYPVVVKPRRSRVLAAGEYVKTGVAIAFDEASLREAARDLPEGAFPLLLQGRLTGDGVGYFALAREGAPLAEFYHRRLRELPASGGVSVLRESIPPDDAMKRGGRAILKHLNWTGPAMVEFKRGADGVPRLIEVNGRFWGSLQLAIDAGIDFPNLLAKAAIGEAFPVPSYRYGVRLRHLTGDLESLITVLLKGRRSLPPGVATRAEYARKFFAVGGRAEIMRVSDPAPFAFDLKRFARKAARLVARRLFPPALTGMVHGHTNFSYDGELRPDRLALHLDRQGLRFAAISEHENSVTGESFRELQAACETISRGDFVMIPGIEFATPRRTHILGLGVSEFFDEHDPARIVKGIRERGGVAVLAHPDVGEFERDPEFLRNLDGVELWNSVHDGPFVPSYKNALALREIRQVNPDVLVFGGLDFHKPGHYRGARLRVFAAANRPGAILDALRDGRFETRGRMFSIAARGYVSDFDLAYIRAMRSVIGAARPAVRELRRVRRGLSDLIFGPAWRSGEMVRVLHAIETGNPGGAENMMLTLIDRLPRDRFVSRGALLKHGWLHDRMVTAGTPVDVLPPASKARFVRELTRLCRRHEIRLIQSHEMYMNAMSGLAALLAHTAHVGVVHGNLDYIRPWRRRLAYRLGAMAGSNFVTVSQALKNEFVEITGVPPARVSVIHNGVAVPPERTPDRVAAARERLGVANGPVIAIVGSLYRVKGHAVFLDAMPKLIEEAPGLNVFFIGRDDRDVADEVKQRAAGFGGVVRVLGYRSDVADLLPGVDIGAMPSLYEGLSLTLCETMAEGVPVVATRVGGNPEVVTDGVDGFLVPPGDPDALAERIVTLLKDAPLREAMGRAARETIVSRFSIERMIRAYGDFYEDLLMKGE